MNKLAVGASALVAGMVGSAVASVISGRLAGECNAHAELSISASTYQSDMSF